MPGTSDFNVNRQLLLSHRRMYDSNRIIAVLQPGYGTTALRTQAGAQRLQIDAVRPLFTSTAATALHGTLPRTAATTGGDFRLSDVYVMRVRGADARTAAGELVRSGLARFAEPDWTIDSLIADQRPVPAQAIRAFRANSMQRRTFMTSTSPIPNNTGLVSAFQSYLNSNGVDAVPAF